MLKTDPDTGDTTFLPPVRPPILHRRNLQAALDILDLEANASLSEDAQKGMDLTFRLLGLDREEGGPR